jgi:hypothetical protein
MRSTDGERSQDRHGTPDRTGDLNRQDAKIAKKNSSSHPLGDLGVLAVQWFFAVMPILTDWCMRTQHFFSAFMHMRMPYGAYSGRGG